MIPLILEGIFSNDKVKGFAAIGAGYQGGSLSCSLPLQETVKTVLSQGRASLQELRTSIAMTK